MLQYERISNFMKKLIFCKVPVHSHQTVWEIKLLILSKEQKEQRVRLHFSFLSMLYFIWVKLLYSHLEQRNLLYYIKNKTQSVQCFKLAIISPPCSSNNYLNSHLSCIPWFKNKSLEWKLYHCKHWKDFIQNK